MFLVEQGVHMTDRFTLLVHTPSPDDATSFYRALGPLSAMKKQCDWLNLQVAVTTSAKFGWTTVAGVDAVFLQRPATYAALQLALRAHLHGIPVWVDFDDALGHVPPDNPVFTEFDKSSTQKYIKDIMALADVVTVSTPLLRELIETETNREVTVIPNALMDFFMGPIKERRDQNPAIVWRGSDTHMRDLMSHTTDLLFAAKNLPDISWFFLGYKPWFIVEQMDKDMWRSESLVGIIEYFHRLRQIAPSVVAVPLVDNIFNRSKSNIAWIEATWAGAATVASNLPEFVRPGVFHHEENAPFGQLIVNACSGNELSYQSWRHSKDYIEKHLKIDHVNKQRFAVLSILEKFRNDVTWVQKTMKSVPLRFER